MRKIKKSCINKTLNLSACAKGSTNTKPLVQKLPSYKEKFKKNVYTYKVTKLQSYSNQVTKLLSYQVTKYQVTK